MYFLLFGMLLLSPSPVEAQAPQRGAGGDPSFAQKKHARRDLPTRRGRKLRCAGAHDAR
jgi:hypothetical protein